MNVSRETLRKSERELLLKSASTLGVDLSDAQTVLLFEFLKELRRWNERINLIGPASPEEQVVLHLVDSLAPLKFLPDSPAKVLDLGSGAGLPGLVLAIMRPQWTVTMVEARAKKTDFIRYAARKLGLDNVEIRQERLEKGRKAFPEHFFDVVTFRALGHLKDVLPLVAAYVRDSGLVLAYKGPEGEIEWSESEPIARKMGFRLAKTEEIILPLLAHRRTLLFIEPSSR